jgi:hypothetical protein
LAEASERVLLLLEALRAGSGGKDSTERPPGFWLEVLVSVGVELEVFWLTLVSLVALDAESDILVALDAESDILVELEDVRVELVG